MRGAFGRGVPAVVVGASHVDLDIVDGRAGAVGEPQIQAAELHVELDDDDRAREARPRQVELDRPHAPVQRQPAGHHPLALALQRSEHAAQFHAVGGRGDDGAGTGQVTDERVEVGT